MIKKFNDMYSINEELENNNYYTIGELKEFIKDLPDNSPVLIVNPVGRGSNEYISDSIKIEDVKIDDKGYSTYINDGFFGSNNRTGLNVVKGLIIYEG